MELESLNETIFENVINSSDKFTKHFHDTYTIGLTHDGKFKSMNQNKISLSYKYSTRVINPGEVHCGDSHSWKYTNFYPSMELLSSIYEQIFFEKKAPIFEKHIISDPYLYGILYRFFYCIYNNEDKMIIETNLIIVLSYLIKNYTYKSKKIEVLFDDKIIIKNSIELIKDSLDLNISLDLLADNSNLSKYHFLRVFKKNTGTTPHQYILIQRIEKAKHLILNGTPLSQIAPSLGFADQSHFIRNFKKLYGYSPKELNKKSNFILFK